MTSRGAGNHVTQEADEGLMEDAAQRATLLLNLHFLYFAAVK